MKGSGEHPPLPQAAAGQESAGVVEFVRRMKAGGGDRVCIQNAWTVNPNADDGGRCQGKKKRTRNEVDSPFLGGVLHCA